MALCFVGCSKDDDEPGGKGAMYEVTIEQSGDFRSFIKSVVVVANGTQLKDGATGESLASPVILSDEELAVEKVTLSTTGKAIEFAVSGGVVDGEDGVVNEPMQWVVTVYKNLDVPRMNVRGILFLLGVPVGRSGFTLQVLA